MKMDTKKTPAVILGFSVNGLSVARSLGRKGIPVIAVDRTKHLSVTCSRYIQKFFRFDSSDYEKEILDFLLDFGEKSGQKMYLHPTNDLFVLFVSRNRSALRQYYLFTIADEEVIETVVSKKLFYYKIKGMGIPYPKTYCVDSVEGVHDVLDEIPFPCFIKPVYSHIWRDRYSTLKGIVAQNADELLTRLREILSLGIEVLIQEIIPGNDSDIYGVVAYLDSDHNPITLCSKKKVRQHPIGMGIGSVQVSIQNRELENLGVRLLRNLRYVGPACNVEFKQDSRDGSYKVFEVNARTEICQELMTRAGCDIPYTAYAYTVYGKAPAQGKYKAGLKWICFEWDFHSFLQARRMGILTFREWLQSIWGAKVFAYFCWDDPVPFVIQTLAFLRSGVGRMFKPLWRVRQSLRIKKECATLISAHGGGRTDPLEIKIQQGVKTK